MSGPRFAIFERDNPPEGNAQLVVGYKTSTGAKLQMRMTVDHAAAVLVGNEALAIARGVTPMMKAVVEAMKKADTGEYGAGASRLMNELLAAICDAAPAQQKEPS